MFWLCYRNTEFLEVLYYRTVSFPKKIIQSSVTDTIQHETIQVHSILDVP